MKKIKMLAAAAFVCAVGFTSYTAYDKATMTDAERMMQANIDALSEEVLTRDEGDDISYACEDSISSGDSKVFYCGVCDFVSNSEVNWTSSNKTCRK